MQTEKTVDTTQQKPSRYQRIVNKIGVATVTGVGVVGMAHAEGLDMSQGTTQLALALAAIGALGAAKLAPAALTWVWGIVTRTASRS